MQQYCASCYKDLQEHLRANIQCTTCRGFGRLDCPNDDCYNGQIEGGARGCQCGCRYWDDCADCQGDGNLPCPDCSGAGLLSIDPEKVKDNLLQLSASLNQ